MKLQFSFQVRADSNQRPSCKIHGTVPTAFTQWAFAVVDELNPQHHAEDQLEAFGGMKVMARSVMAVIVRLGFTPRLAGTADPSHTQIPV